MVARMITPSAEFRLQAIHMAGESRAAGDYAVGSVLVQDGKVLARAGNRTHLDSDPTQHAEMIVIKQSAAILKSKDLTGCTLYSTHEPCPMCASAAVWARLSVIVYGATIDDHKRYRDEHGNPRWRWRVIDIPAQTIVAAGDPHIELVGGFMRAEWLALYP
jgi:tRNA(adenine34) deaminase